MKKSILNVSFAVIMAVTVAACGKSESVNECSATFLNEKSALEIAAGQFRSNFNDGTLQVSEAKDFCNTFLTFAKKYDGHVCMHNGEKLLTSTNNAEVHKLSEACQKVKNL